MATSAQCAYCFECLSANLAKKKPMSLAEVEESWERYIALDDTESVPQEDVTYRPAAVSRLIAASPLGTTPSSSVHSASSSTPSLNTNASSTTSQSSLLSMAKRLSRSKRQTSQSEEFPLFVTWDTRTRSGSKNLRGCIGTFEPQELDEGLRTYAITAALEDTRFMPISQRELPSLDCSVTLLTDFEPIADSMDWQIGKHGIRINFTQNGRRYGSTFLPDVAKEQGWTKEKTLTSLMRKAGWNGREDEWNKVALNVVRYQGKKTSLSYAEWLKWKQRAG